MRVGIMGGTLDPVHIGHIEIALAAMKALALDRMMLLPAGDPPHKENPCSREHRFEMARLAAGGIDGLSACGIEIFREGRTYTVDTLRHLRTQNPNTQWYYLIGADTLNVLDTWRDFASVAQMCCFAVVGRGDEDIDPAQIDFLKRNYGAEFVHIPVNGPDISSTEIRRRVRQGLPIDDMVPVPVAAYIREKGLYLTGMPEDEMLDVLRGMIKPSRFAHTCGVMETAVRLAPGCGVSTAKARLAAMLHDCAKSVASDEMLRRVRTEIPDTDEEELETECVLHAPMGSLLARDIFGIQDPEILSAIRKHTIGDAEMSPLDALIYTADFIEPGRKPFPGLEDARQLAETDIYAAMCKCARLSGDYLRVQGKAAHSKTDEMIRNYG